MLVAGKIFSGFSSPRNNNATSKSINKPNFNFQKVSKFSEKTVNLNTTPQTTPSFQFYSTKQTPRRNVNKITKILSSPLRPNLIFRRYDSEEVLLGYLKSHQFNKLLKNYESSVEIEPDEYIYLFEFGFSDKKYRRPLATFYRDMIKYRPSFVAMNYFLSKTIQNNLIEDPPIPFDEIWEDIEFTLERTPSVIRATTFAYFLDIYSKLGDFEKFNMVYKYAKDYVFERTTSKRDKLYEDTLTSEEFQEFKKSLSSYDAKSEEFVKNEFDVEEVIYISRVQKYRKLIDEHLEEAGINTKGNPIQAVKENKLQEKRDLKNNNQQIDDEEEVNDEDGIDEDGNEEGNEEEGIDDEEEIDEEEKLLDINESDVKELLAQEVPANHLERSPKLFPFVLSRCNFSDIDGIYKDMVDSVDVSERALSAIFDRINIEIEKDIKAKKSSSELDNEKPFLDISPDLLKKLHQYFIELKKNFPLSSHHLELLLSKSTSSAIADKYTTLFLLESVKMTEGSYDALFTVYQRDSNTQKKIDELYAHMILSLEDPRLDRTTQTEEEVRKLQAENLQFKQKLIEQELEKKFPYREDFPAAIQAIENNIKTESPLVDFHHRTAVNIETAKREEERDSWNNFRDLCDQKLKKEITLRQLKKLVHDPRWPAYVSDYISTDVVNRPLIQSLEKASDILLNYVDFFYKLSTATVGDDIPPHLVLLDNNIGKLFADGYLGRDAVHPREIAADWLDKYSSQEFSIDTLIADLAPFPLKLRFQIAGEVLFEIYTREKNSIEEMKKVEDKFYRTTESSGLHIFHQRLVDEDEDNNNNNDNSNGEEVGEIEKIAESDKQNNTLQLVEEEGEISIAFENLLKEKKVLFYPEQVQQTLFELTSEYYKDNKEYNELSNEKKLDKVLEDLEDLEKSSEIVGHGKNVNLKRRELFLKFQQQYFENYFEVSKDFENYKKMIGEENPVDALNIFINKYNKQNLEDEKIGFIVDKLLSFYGNHFGRAEKAISKSSDWDQEANEFTSEFDVFDYTINPIQCFGYASEKNLNDKLPENKSILIWRRHLRDAREEDADVKYLSNVAFKKILMSNPRTRELFFPDTIEYQEGDIQKFANQIKEFFNLKRLNPQEFKEKTKKMREELLELKNSSAVREVLEEYEAKLKTDIQKVFISTKEDIEERIDEIYERKELEKANQLKLDQVKEEYVIEEDQIAQVNENEQIEEGKDEEEEFDVAEIDAKIAELRREEEENRLKQVKEIEEMKNFVATGDLGQLFNLDKSNEVDGELADELQNYITAFLNELNEVETPDTPRAIYRTAYGHYPPSNSSYNKYKGEERDPQDGEDELNGLEVDFNEKKKVSLENLKSVTKEYEEAYQKYAKDSEKASEILSEWWNEIKKEDVQKEELNVPEGVLTSNNLSTESKPVTKEELEKIFPGLSAEETSKLENLVNNTKQLNEKYFDIYSSKSVPVQTLGLIRDILTGCNIFEEETANFIESHPEGISFSELIEPIIEGREKEIESKEVNDEIEDEIEIAKIEEKLDIGEGGFDEMEQVIKEYQKNDIGDMHIAREFDYKDYHQTESKEDYANFSLEKLQEYTEVFNEKSELTPYQQYVLNSFTYKGFIANHRSLLAKKDTEIDPSPYSLLPQNNISGAKELLKDRLYDDALQQVENALRDVNPNFPPQLTSKIFRNLIRYQAEFGGDFDKAIEYYKDLIFFGIKPSEGVYYWLLKLAKDKFQENNYDKFLEIIDFLYHEWKIYLSDQIPSKRVDNIINVLPSRKKDIIHVGRLKFDPVYRAKNLLQEEFLNNPKRFDIMVNEQYCSQIEFKGYFHNSLTNHGLDNMFKEDAYKQLEEVLVKDIRNKVVKVDGANVKIQLDDINSFPEYEHRRGALQGYISQVERITDMQERLKFGVSPNNSAGSEASLQLNVPERTVEEKKRL